MTDYTKINGVAAADIVKIDGVAIADVEKVDGATKPSGAAIDWTESLWMDDNLTSDLGLWSATGARRMFANATGSSNNANMDHTVVPFIDDSGATTYLKFMCPLIMGSGSDEQFLEVDEGTRVQVNGGTNPDQAAKSDTGIAFDGSGNLTDGQHVVKVGYKHVPTGKGSTLYRRQTAVIDVSSNVMKAYTRSTNNTGSGVAYYTAVATIAAGRCDWAFEYDPDTNTWTNEGSATDTGFWHRLTHADVATGPNDAGDGCEKTISTYYVDSDVDEHRIWYFKSG